MIFTTSTAASELGISSTRVRAMIASGRLQATKHGRDWIISQSQLESVRVRKPGRPKKPARSKQS